MHIKKVEKLISDYNSGAGKPILAIEATGDKKYGRKIYKLFRDGIDIYSGNSDRMYLHIKLIEFDNTLKSS